MVIMMVILFLAAVGLAVWAFLPSKEPQAFQNENPATGNTRSPADEQLAIRFENHINSLNAELEKLQTEHGNVQTELQLANKVVGDLKDELEKARQSVTNERLELKTINTDNIKIADTLVDKSRQLEKELSENLNLSKELKESKERLLVLEQEKTELSSKINLLQEQITGYNKELERQKGITEAQKQEGEQISKKEYDLLSEKMQQGMGRLEELHKENTALVEKIKALNSQIEQQKQEIEGVSKKGSPQQPDSDWVSRKEFEEVKRKLETAENVLKIVHGEVK